MPSASNYTNRVRFAASIKNTKAQLPGGIGNLTQPSISGCGLGIQYNTVDYVELCKCKNIRSGASLFITTIAGNGGAGYSGDNIPATESQINGMRGISVDSSGNIYIADSLNHRIRKVDISGIITTIVGTGTAGYSGDNNLALDSQLNIPTSIFVNSIGNIYIADSLNHRIRKVDESGIITTIVGTGIAGYAGDNNPALDSEIANPQSVFGDPNGNLYIADSQNHRIRKIDRCGIITTIAGTGIAGYSGDNIRAIDSQLSFPTGVFVDSNGNIYIADSLNHRIRKIDTFGTITTIAGTGIAGYAGDNNPALNSEIANPQSVFGDSNGNIYITDSQNHRIRKIDRCGIITTIAGTGIAGYSGDNIRAIDSQLSFPTGVFVDSNGSIYVADSGHDRIHKLYYA